MVFIVLNCSNRVKERGRERKRASTRERERMKMKLAKGGHERFVCFAPTCESKKKEKENACSGSDSSASCSKRQKSELGTLNQRMNLRREKKAQKKIAEIGGRLLFV